MIGLFDLRGIYAWFLSLLHVCPNHTCVRAYVRQYMRVYMHVYIR